MNYITPGLRELGRIFDRQYRRVRLAVWEQRKLARLESHLGLLGWQQADFGSDAQQHVDHLAGVERRQAELTNESASLGLNLQQLEEKRAAERMVFEGRRADRNAARNPLLAPVEEGEKTLSAKQKERKELEERVATLDREKAADEERYRELLAKGTHNPQQEEEVQRLRTRVMMLPRETQEWQQKLTVMVQSEIPRLETELEQHRARLAGETDALRALEKSFAEGDQALADEIAKHKRDKLKLEKQINALEKAKTKPYREIGKVLADQGIEPANQPEALGAVLAQREHIVAEEAWIVESLEASRRENRIEVWGSWSLLFTIAALLGGVLWFTLLRGR